MGDLLRSHRKNRNCSFIFLITAFTSQNGNRIIVTSLASFRDSPCAPVIENKGTLQNLNATPRGDFHTVRDLNKQGLPGRDFPHFQPPHNTRSFRVQISFYGFVRFIGLRVLAPFWDEINCHDDEKIN
jgi:hypothetical protein